MDVLDLGCGLGSVLLHIAWSAPSSVLVGVEAQAVRLTALRRGFDAATLAEPLVHGRLFDGLAEVLARWHGRRPLVVVTNKPTVLSRRVLDAAGVLHFFVRVHGADTPAQRKPAPALLHEAASALGIATGALLMVGDSVNDARSAAAAGCPLAWAGWGYGGRTPPGGAAAWVGWASPVTTGSHSARSSPAGRLVPGPRSPQASASAAANGAARARVMAPDPVFRGG